jgi:hypothetical protein
MATLLSHALFDGDRDWILDGLRDVINAKPSTSTKICFKSGHKLRKIFRANAVDEGATSGSSTFDSATSFVTSSDVLQMSTKQIRQNGGHTLSCYSTCSLDPSFMRESENKSGRQSFVDSNTDLYSFMKFRSSSSSFDIVGIFRISL